MNRILEMIPPTPIFRLLSQRLSNIDHVSKFPLFLRYGVL